MAGRRAGGATARGGDPAARLRTPAFRRALAARLHDELRGLGARRIGDLVERESVRRLIRDLDHRLLDRAGIAEVLLAANRRLSRRLARRTESPQDLVDQTLLADLDAVLEQQVRLTPRAEAFVRRLMGQEFIHGLFTDLIYAALVSFYSRVNPLFGGLAMRALEGQIKAFIRFFMPMVEERATAFAVAPGNQRVVVAFARALLRQFLAVPLGRWAELAAAGPQQSVETLVRRAAANQRLGRLVRQAALAGWDELHGALRDRTVGELLRVDMHAGWLAERAADLLIPLLARPGVLELVGAVVPTQHPRSATPDGTPRRTARKRPTPAPRRG